MASTDTVEQVRLPNLESLGDATEYATQIHGMISYSRCSRISTWPRSPAEPFHAGVPRRAGVEVVREGEAGDFMMMLIEVGSRCSTGPLECAAAHRLIDPGKTVGEMSMIDGEPRFATCVAAERCTIAVLTRENLARIILEQPILGRRS